MKIPKLLSAIFCISLDIEWFNFAKGKENNQMNKCANLGKPEHMNVLRSINMCSY